MTVFHPGDIRATLWPKRLLEVRRKLTRSSVIIVALGLLALSGNAFWVWHDRNEFIAAFNLSAPRTWFHPAPVNSLLIAVIMLYALRQIAKTRRKLAPLGYPLLEAEEKVRGVEVWTSVEPLTKRPAMLYMIHPERSGVGRDAWREVSHRWVRRSEKARRLNSPHVARVLDAGYAQHERFYTVVEMPRGLRFDELVRAHGALPVNRAVFLMAQVAHAVQEAHEAGLFGLALHPRHCWVGSRSSNVDWVTVMVSGHCVDEEATTDAGPDLRAFALILLGLLSGTWPSAQDAPSAHAAVIDRLALPYGIASALHRCLNANATDALPPVEEIVRGMWASLPGPFWNNDLAEAWWNDRKQEQAAS